MNYRWLQARLWLTLILYWLGSMIGGKLLVDADMGRSQTGWVILLMLCLLIACMVTERGQWKIWKRVLFIPFAWVAQAILSIPVTLFLVPAFVAAGRVEDADRMIAFLSSLPIVLWAMRRSRLYVVKQQPVEQAKAL